MTVDRILAESAGVSPVRVRKLAKQFGIKTDPRSITNLIHERRKTRRSA